ncbi:MAG: MTH1187 family thiamine-binding protein [Nitrososphaerota archaeon]|jgi:uncharacterized protein (TIGR00106 family)|nr:MTH1187 family thiamine-binding protein [Nitrososphaerota archaeon]
MPKVTNKVVAEFSIHPIGAGTSVGRYVRAAVNVLAGAPGVRIQVNPMATVLEADNVEQIFRAVSSAHEEVFRLGAQRVDFILRVDDRRDKPRTMEDKVKAVTK